MKNLFTSVLSILLAVTVLNGRDYKISSPDGKISVTITAGKTLAWSAYANNSEVISLVKASMILSDGWIIGENDPVRKSTNGSRNETIKPVVPHKRSLIADNYNFITIYFRSGSAITFRVYNDGVAYRFETSFPDSITVKNETCGISFPVASESWFPFESGFMSHNENTFRRVSLDTITDNHLASLPVLVKVGGANVVITESAVEEYPGMWLRGAGGCRLSGTWPAYPDSEQLKGDRDLFVSTRKDFIACTGGTRTFPWRVFVISADDRGLVESDLVYRLAAPNRLAETSWIKPGKVAWDWWNANNIYGVDFRAGLNNDTYKYYIDFASANGIEYVILDEGWYRNGNVLDVAPGFDIAELCSYAESRNVGIILWVVWKSFYDQIDNALEQYGRWGVRGVKVDFMQRDDQKMMKFYYETTRKTAEHKMLIDFHGSCKPDGLGRTYPNAITREGVKGMEHNKWSRDVNPEHDVTIPFTRMVAGPMDYTPGAMVNMERPNFTPVFSRPASQGTRAHQMALYIVFESPLQMLADSPSNYLKEKECTDFIVKVPVVWDDIKVLDARIGDYLLVARKSGSDWFIGGLTDWNERDLELDLSFLGQGDFAMDIFRDGINADRYAGDYKHLRLDVNSGTKMNIHLAPGGGWAARIVKK